MTARSYDRLSFILTLVFGFGVMGFIPYAPGLAAPLPIEVASILTGVGIIGLSLLRCVAVQPKID